MGTTRPKGFMENWQPQAHVAEVVHQAQAVLREYASYGPMTVRQIFYRLVGQYDYPKDERAYNRLAEYMVKARRSGMVGFHSIRDDGTIAHGARNQSDRGDVWDYLKDIVGRPHDFLHLDRNNGQPYHLELWCEAAGMAPMLSRMVEGRDVSVYSTGGFSSVTVTYEVADRVARRSKPTFFLHVGDFDPSGESIFTSMSQDIGSFVAGKLHGYVYGDGKAENADEREWFCPMRVALTAEQVEEFDLPTAPPKRSDSRSARWVGETTQAEAMPPTLLEQVVTGALDDLTDQAALDELVEREQKDKDRLRAAVEEKSVTQLLDQADLMGEDPTLLELVEAIAADDLGNEG